MTTRRTLRISEQLALPADFATKSAAILAQRRKGKSYTAAVIAEECVATEIPFVILDPTGARELVDVQGSAIRASDVLFEGGA